jgi:hypothetical protein
MLYMLPWLSYAMTQEEAQQQLVEMVRKSSWYTKNDVYLEKINVLLKGGASFSMLDKYGRTPIFYAISEDSPEYIINNYPIDLAIYDNDGYTLYEYLLKESLILDIDSSYDVELSLKFMNFMEEHNAVYDINKILFDSIFYGRDRRNIFVGKTIPQIKQKLEKLSKRNQAWSNFLDPIISLINPATWLLSIVAIVIVAFYIFLFSCFFYIIWLVLSGRLFKILKYIKRETDKKDM